MSEVIVIARAKAQPGREEAIQRALTENAEASRREAGCVSYSVLSGDDGTFMTVERWRSHLDFNQHMGTPHVQSLLQTIVPMVDGPPEIKVMKEV
ncbi:MAG: putative quinol monooxygenase [Thermoanaerobaculia bacterium]